MTEPTLTRAEAAVLDAVGRRLGNAEIAAEAVVSVRTVESHIASLRRKLGADSRAELIAHAEERRRRAVAAPTDAFIGRREELDRLERLLERHRLVTVTGAAGSGKSRLAIEFATRQRRPLAVVGLAHAPTDPGEAIAAAVGAAADRDAVASAALALDRPGQLLVLDDADRVAASVRATVDRLLAIAPRATILVTARAPIGSPLEVVLPLDPLGDDAVELLLARAGTAAPGAPSPDRDHARRIVRALDGLPLAIELAAARLRQVSPAELADRLEADPLAVESGGTLDRAFALSWDPLDERSRTILARLAALPGPFDLDLAEAITGAAAGEVLALADRSLLAPVPHTRPAEFRMLAVLRESVAARRPEDAAEGRARHAAVLAQRLAAAARTARRDDHPATAAAFRRRHRDAVAALDWALEHDPPLAATLAGAIGVLVEQYSTDAEVLTALARASRDARLLAEADAEGLAAIGRALCFGDMSHAAALVAPLDAAATDDRARLAAHVHAGFCHAYLGQVPAALARLDEAELLARRLGDRWMLASALQARGMALGLETPAEALPVLEAAMDAFASAGDAMHVSNTRYMLAATAVDLGDDRALTWLDQCVAYGRSVGNEHEVAHALLTRARLLGPGDELAEAMATFTALGDLRCLTRSHLLLAAEAEPRPHLERALELATRAHDPRHAATALQRLVALDAATGRLRAAARSLGALAIVVGDDAAAAARPAALDESWDPVVAEGRATAATQWRPAG